MRPQPVAALVAMLLLSAVAPVRATMFVPQTPEAPNVEILQPAEQELLNNVQGAVMVDLAVRELDDDEEIVLLLDGQEVARESEPPEFIVLEAVSRGEHKLEVLIVDADDDVVDAAPARTFYLRKSTLPPG